MPKKVNYAEIAKAHRALGGTLTATARRLGVHRGTVRNALRQTGLNAALPGSPSSRNGSTRSDGKTATPPKIDPKDLSSLKTTFEKLMERGKENPSELIDLLFNAFEGPLREIMPSVFQEFRRFEIVHTPDNQLSFHLEMESGSDLVTGSMTLRPIVHPRRSKNPFGKQAETHGD